MCQSITVARKSILAFSVARFTFAGVTSKGVSASGGYLATKVNTLCAFVDIYTQCKGQNDSLSQGYERKQIPLQTTSGAYDPNGLFFFAFSG